MSYRGKSSGKSQHVKLKELIIYIANELKFHPAFGATKLNKILFFADFHAYAKLGKSITGEEYFKLPFGPAPRYLKPSQEELEKNGDIVAYKNMTAKGPQKRIMPVREANLKKFSAEEIAIVDWIISELKDYDSEEVSGLSHKFYGWKTAKTGATIPYHTIFLHGKQIANITEHKRKVVDKLIQKYGTAE